MSVAEHSAVDAEPRELAGAVSAEDLAALGRPIKGPSALGSDPSRLWHLTWTLARTEFKLAFFGSALGYLWQLMRPLLLFGVIYAVVSTVFGRFATVPFYPAALLLGIVLFNFYSESTGGAVASLLNRENLVRKIEFPRLAVPLATVLTALFNLTLNLIPVAIFLLAEGGSVRLSWLEVPLLMLALAAFASGLGMLLSVAYVRYRDVRPIWEVILQMTFYASPIFYPITQVHHVNILGWHINLAHVMLANPFVAVLQQARHALIDPRHPTPAHALGGGATILIPIGIALAVIALGFVAFDREAPRVAEQL
jgi:ABC-2 type transport system permease protein